MISAELLGQLDAALQAALAEHSAAYEKAKSNKEPSPGPLPLFERHFEPLLLGITSEQRESLGETLWEERTEWLKQHGTEELYPRTELAVYLKRSLNNSGS